MAIGIKSSPLAAGVTSLADLEVPATWAYFTCRDGRPDVEGSSYTHILDRSKGTYGLATADLSMVGTLGTAWSANVGWFKGTGATTHHFNQTAPAAYSALWPSTGNMLVWAAINYDTVAGTVTSPCFLALGDQGSGNSSIRFSLERSTRKLRTQHRSSSSASAVTTTFSGQTITTEVDANIAYWIQWTPTAFSAYTWINSIDVESKTLVVADRPTPFSNATQNYITIGGGYSAGAASTVGWEGSVRNIGIIQYGDNPPASISTIVTKLHQSNGFLNWGLA